MNKKWLVVEEKSVLFSAPQYEMEIMARVWKDEGLWVYDSKITEEEYGFLDSENLEDAKEEVVDIIIQHYEDEINYINYLLAHFKGTL